MNNINDIVKAQQVRNQIKLLAGQILTKEARERLANIRIVKPDLAYQIELYLIQLYQAGQIKSQITDEQLKALLLKLQSKKKSKISFR
jgi:programmed cell death protein 5